MDIKHWSKYILTPLLNGNVPAVANLEALGGVALLAADTDRTQDYVFESTRLPEIRGASQQLKDLNVQIANLVGERFDPKCVISKGGGSLLALVPHNVKAVDKLCRDIESAYPQITDVATITAAWRPVTVQWVLEGYPTGGFGGLTRWAAGWLQRRKHDKAPGPFFEAPSHAVRCQSCHTRPAEVFESYNDHAMCSSCRNKRRYKGRRSWFKEFQDFLAENGVHHQQYYAGQFPFPPFPTRNSNDDPQLPWLPQDLAELGQASLGKPGYVGMIHLDGDGFGELFFRLPTAQAYTTFSNQVKQETQNAVFTALAQHLQPQSVLPSKTRSEVGQKIKPGERVRIHPFEIITIGGDDVWLIVPGDVALPIAATISHIFAEADLRHPADSKRCTLSGGVVIADDHNPVRVLQDVAKQLTREAKRARKQVQAEEGYLDFHVFKSADMLDRRLSTLRKGYPYKMPDRDSGLGKALKLYARPYPASQLLNLWHSLGTLRAQQFPTSQMHLLAEALFWGRGDSTLYYAYQSVRDTEGHFTRLDKALATIQTKRSQDPIPWQKLEDNDYSYHTALWDIAEVYDFVTVAAQREAKYGND